MSVIWPLYSDLKSLFFLRLLPFAPSDFGGSPISQFDEGAICSPPQFLGLTFRLYSTPFYKIKSSKPVHTSKYPNFSKFPIKLKRFREK